jgi:hypothetical protein
VKTYKIFRRFNKNIVGVTDPVGATGRLPPTWEREIKEI